MEFDCIKTEILSIRLNLTVHDNHVGEVERSIQTIKERVRSNVHSMPFKRLPKMMIDQLGQWAVTVLNQFPALDGISDTNSLLTIVTGRAIPDYHTMKIEFGLYAHVFEDNSPTNTNKARTNHGRNCSQPDRQRLGKMLSRAQWTLLPMPDAAYIRS